MAVSKCLSGFILVVPCALLGVRLCAGAAEVSALHSLLSPAPAPNFTPTSAIRTCTLVSQLKMKLEATSLCGAASQSRTRRWLYLH